MTAPANILPLSRVINVSVSQTSLGINQFNPNNVALFSDEVPANSFGTNGYKLYQNSSDVATDFGSTSSTYLMAVAGFAQNPNLLSGNGQLIIITLLLNKFDLALSGIPASGTFEISSANGVTAAINWNDTVGVIQTKLQAVTGQSKWTVTGSLASQDLKIITGGTYGETATVTVAANSLQTGGAVGITFTITDNQESETLGAAITRTQGVVNYCGILQNLTYATIGSTDTLAAAAIVQALPLMLYIVTYTEADIQAAGIGSQLVAGSFTHTRLLFYGDSTVAGQNAMNFAAAYVFRAHCVNFSGSNTFLDIDLKQLATILPDPNMTSTIGGTTGEAATNGADIYASVDGFPCVLVSGANLYWDQVYGSIWLSMALQIAGFNYLAQTNTKVPQTDPGVTGYKAALGVVMQQAVTCGFGASGLVWTGSIPFGDPQTFANNITAVGWYLFAAPIAQQSAADRNARKMPLVQGALKEAGSAETSQIVINLQP